MSGLDAQIAGLERAVEAVPDDAALRVLLARTLAEAGRSDDAVRHAAIALSLDPEAVEALDLVKRGGRPSEHQILSALDAQFGPDQAVVPPAETPVEAVPKAGPDSPRGLADVAGMRAVKERLERVYFGPLRNPAIADHYGITAGGGLLLYGPPGCGKTYVARAVAAEIGANFLPATVADLYGPYLGESEQNIQNLFDEAVRRAPSVIFLDEIDAIGHRRSAIRGGGSARGAVNQLLSAMDGTGSRGVLTIAATNHPWDIDSALRRPGRLDRAVLVEPPDRDTRIGVLAVHLRGRPTHDLDLGRVADRTDGFSGADLAHVVTSAVQVLVGDALRTGVPRPVTTADLLAQAAEISPSTTEWFATARTVIRFNRSHDYDDLRDYLRRLK